MSWSMAPIPLHSSIFKIPDLECDYFATSLHKWMCAPFGSGLLYVKKDKISKIWTLSLMPSHLETRSPNSRHWGPVTLPAKWPSAALLISTWRSGSERKEKRLRELKDYWTTRVKDLPGIHIKTSFNPKFACVIGLVSVDGKKPGEVVRYLFDKYKIHTTGIEWENISGTRVTPNVYTTFRDLISLSLPWKKYPGRLFTSLTDKSILNTLK